MQGRRKDANLFLTQVDMEYVTQAMQDFMDKCIVPLLQCVCGVKFDGLDIVSGPPRERLPVGIANLAPL
jgi:hypothetical protein